MNNLLINLKIEQNNYHKEYDKRINNNSSLLSELRLERQFIKYFLKERYNNYKLIVTGKESKEYNNRINVLGQHINILS